MHQFNLHKPTIGYRSTIGKIVLKNIGYRFSLKRGNRYNTSKYQVHIIAIYILNRPPLAVTCKEFLGEDSLPEAEAVWTKEVRLQ